MLLNIASVIIFLVVSLNLFFRLDCPAWLRIGGTLLVLFVSCKYLVYQYLGGAFFCPALPRQFLIIMEGLYGALIVLFFLLLLWDMYLAGNWLLARFGVPIPRHLPTGAIRAALTALALLAGFWGTWEAVRVPNVKTVEIQVSGLPAAMENFAIVQLSDLHIGPLLNRAWLEEVVDRANAAKPDLVALTGDYIDGRAADIAGELSPLARLEAPYGVFGVTGNHEYYWNAREWLEVLKKLGVQMLENENRRLQIGDDTLVIGGIPDLVADRFGMAGPDIKKALGDAGDAIRILLAHQPKHAREYAPYADLHLAGHTHGGLMFFLQPLVSRFNNGFVRGLYNLDAKNLYVSPGTGLWNGFSCRIGDPAEITKIILKKA